VEAEKKKTVGRTGGFFKSKKVSKKYAVQN